MNRILIVDDQPEITELVEEFLTIYFEEKTTTNIETASSGQAALELISKSIYDLVITDYHMPGFNGVDLLKEIRQTEGPNQNCPVIFLTATDEEVSQELAGQFKEVHVLNKIVEIPVLMEIVSKYIN